MDGLADVRLDLLMVRKNLALSRTEAQRLISDGMVTVDGQCIEKSNRRFPVDSEVVVTRSTESYVSRGGIKLAAALKAFHLDVTGHHCLDIGISTGGFTDCLLQAGAAHVTGIDVGHGQLSTALSTDQRITLFEGINARHLVPDQFPHKFSIVTMDVSFISLLHILPPVTGLLSPFGIVICLIKPQFEVGAGNVGKHGVVTDLKLCEEARERIHDCARSIKHEVLGSIDSPITGGDGNREYLSCFRSEV